MSAFFLNLDCPEAMTSEECCGNRSPIDPTLDEKILGAHQRTWTCTRTKGHEGPHLSHHCAVWSADPTNGERQAVIAACVNAINELIREHAEGIHVRIGNASDALAEALERVVAR